MLNGKVKNDRISKILSAFSNEGDGQQSFRLLSQKIKHKIGSQISEHQQPTPRPVSDHKKNLISVKDLLTHKQKKSGSLRRGEALDKLNKTQSEIYKSYLAARTANGSKTYRDSRDLETRINDKSTQSQQALLQTLISNEKKSVGHRDSPDLCCTPQNLINLLQQSANSLLIRSGSQGNVAQNYTKLKTQEQKITKIKSYLEKAKSYRPSYEPIKQIVQVEKTKVTKMLKIANSVQNKLMAFGNSLIQWEESTSQIQNLFRNKDPDGSIESISSLE